MWNADVSSNQISSMYAQSGVSVCVKRLLAPELTVLKRRNAYVGQVGSEMNGYDAGRSGL